MGDFPVANCCSKRSLGTVFSTIPRHFQCFESSWCPEEHSKVYYKILKKNDIILQIQGNTNRKPCGCVGFDETRNKNIFSGSGRRQ
jgi:hypothetical protein